MDAAALDDLEGAGQAKRLTARVCAEIHNAIRDAMWSMHGAPNSQPPKRMDETLFLPVRVAKPKDQDLAARVRETNQRLTDRLNAMCGF
jgi:hypothetical protein